LRRAYYIKLLKEEPPQEADYIELLKEEPPQDADYIELLKQESQQREDDTIIETEPPNGADSKQQ